MFFEQDNLYLHLTSCVGYSYIFEVSSFFCHCRYICDIISELCHSPEVIVNPNSVTVDWMDKKKNNNKSLTGV